MKLLEKLRSPPEWQNEDPSIRAAAVRDLADEAQDLLIDIAQHDDAPAVRRGAVRRLKSIDVLVSITRSDTDEAVRAEASGMVRHLVIEAEEADAAERGLAVLSDRDLVVAARAAHLESVSRAALSRLTDEHAVGSVARRADRVEVAKEALDRLEDPVELQSVLVKAEEKEIALLAFERLAKEHLSRDTLAVIAKRAKHKAVARRARAALAELDNALAAADQEKPRTDLCARLEALAADDDLRRVRQAFADVLERWAALDGSADPLLSQRFADARRMVEAHLASLEAMQVKARRSDQRREVVLATCKELCREVEQLAGATVRERLRELREAWARLSTSSAGGATTDDVSAPTERFEAAVAACELRYQEWTAHQAQLESVEAIIGEMEELVELGDQGESRARWSAADRAWRDVMSPLRGKTSTTGPETGARVVALQRRKDAVDDRRRELRAAAQSMRERQEQDNLTRLSQRCDTIEGIVTSDKLTLPAAERQLRAARRSLDDVQDPMGRLPLPSRRERETITRRLKHAHKALLGRVRELRDFSDWQRWANLGVQEDLCRQMEALAELSDEAALSHRFRDIMARWRQAADVPKDQGARLWERFKAVHDVVYPRCQAYLKAQAADRETNLKRRLTLIEEAERLSSSTDWLKTAQRVTELQAQWKAVGPVARQQQEDTWNRFRAACNTFFTKRKIDLTERKRKWARHLELKEALSARVEALAETADVAVAMQEVKLAQADWKKIGPVRRARSEAVWQRFRAACDAVFERAEATQREAAADKVAAREALCLELEALLPADDSPGDPPDRLAEAVRELQGRWRQAPEVPEALRRRLIARFGQGIARVVAAYPGAFRGSDLDPTRQLKRLEELCVRVEALTGSEADNDKATSPAETLATRWRDTLASNLMGVRVDEAAERRAAIEEGKRLQAERRRIGQLPGDDGRHLADRFQRACDRLFERAQSRKNPSKDTARIIRTASDT